MSDPQQPTALRASCRHLRSKEMFYQAPGEGEDEFSAGAYWCLKTHEPFGPDGQPATKKDCCDERGCFAS